MIERLGAHTLAELRASYNATYRHTEYGDKDCLYRLAFRRLSPAPGSLLFDVACGAGQWLAYARDRGCEVAGCELSDQALKRAAARVPDALLLLCDGACLPFADASLDFVSCLGSLEHFLDPNAGARELRRVLSARGRAVILLPNSYYSGDIWRVIRSGYGPNHHQIIDRFATSGEWRDLLTRAGLDILALDRYDKGKLWKRLFPFELAYHFLFTCKRSEGQ